MTDQDYQIDPLIKVTQQDFDFILETLKNPAKPNERVRKMMKEYRDKEDAKKESA